MDVPALDDTCGAFLDRPCLPVYELQDLAFQVIARVTGASKETFEFTDFWGQVTTDCPEVDLTRIENFTSLWEQTVVGEGSEPDIWVGNFSFNVSTTFSDLGIGDCFTISIQGQSGFTPENIGCLATCFTRIGDICYTTKMIYSNNQNAFDFVYNGSFANKLRLPMYLHSPTNAEEEKSYSKSDGSSVKLMHRIWKDYRLKTDLFPAHWIEKLTVALAHDTINLTNTYSGVADYFIRMEKVDVDWMQEQSPGVNLAHANTIVRLASARASINSNCV